MRARLTRWRFVGSCFFHVLVRVYPVTVESENVVPTNASTISRRVQHDSIGGTFGPAQGSVLSHLLLPYPLSVDPLEKSATCVRTAWASFFSRRQTKPTCQTSPVVGYN